MAYWNDVAPAASNLRLYVPGEGWKAHADEMDGQNVKSRGTKPLIDSAFLNALNATNLIVLTGAG
ncbi:MAG: hypothetical protein ACK49G_00255, partial [Brevundimonas sp.]|uniref:hypothetical protein n=1 Tax=Brevundimonas sp. TaxID=1871086 RepID=UPI00391D4212